MELNEEIINSMTSKEYKENRQDIQLFYKNKIKQERYTGNLEFIPNKFLNKKEIKQKEYILIKKNKPWLLHLKSIKQRCNNPNSKDYPRYGGRGIRCLLSINDIKFLWFECCAYLMENPSIDRIDNNGNYELSNCCFIEMSENRKKGNKLLLNYNPLNKENINIFKYRTIFLKIYNINQQVYYIIQTKNKQFNFNNKNDLNIFLKKKGWKINYFKLINNCIDKP